MTKRETPVDAFAGPGLSLIRRKVTSLYGSDYLEVVTKTANHAAKYTNLPDPCKSGIIRPASRAVSSCACMGSPAENTVSPHGAARTRPERPGAKVQRQSERPIKRPLVYGRVGPHLQVVGRKYGSGHTGWKQGPHTHPAVTID